VSSNSDAPLKITFVAYRRLYRNTNKVSVPCLLWPYSSNVRQPFAYSPPIMKSEQPLLCPLEPVTNPHTDSLNNHHTLFTIHFNNMLHLRQGFHMNPHCICSPSQHSLIHDRLFPFALVRYTCNYKTLSPLPHHCVWALKVSTNIDHLQVSLKLLMKLLCTRWQM
jgi:hypothetical protein